MEPLHDGGEVDDPQEVSIQFFVSCGEPSKDLHALEEVFYEMASFVALFVQGGPDGRVRARKQERLVKMIQALHIQRPTFSCLCW